MNGEKKIRNQKSWLWNGSIIAALVAAIAVFMVMLQMEKNVLTQYEKGGIYIAAKEIPKGESITKQNYMEYLQYKELDKNCIPKTAISAPQQIDNLVPLYEIEQGVLLTMGMFEPVNEITKNMEKPVIAGFRAEDIYQVVGGVLRAGDRIQLYHVDETGRAYLVWDNVFVQQVFDSSGLAIANTDTNKAAQRINVYMDANEVEEFYSHMAAGSIRVVKVCE